MNRRDFFSWLGAGALSAAAVAALKVGEHHPPQTCLTTQDVPDAEHWMPAALPADFLTPGRLLYKHEWPDAVVFNENEDTITFTYNLEAS